MNYNTGVKNLSLLTDLYELTMMQGYLSCNPAQEAVFDMFIRKNPFQGGYAIFAGLEPLLKTLEDISFSEEDIKYLESLKIFSAGFLSYLSEFSFRGTIYSLDEGSIVFPNEPIMRVHGNLMELQLIESILLNFINFQSLVATKTSRILSASKNATILEFGLRRAQGVNGALSASRAAYIGGASSTSNLLAGKIFNIPVSGTMAHSWVMSFNSEMEAFKAYAGIYSDRCVLLIDTYDTLKSGIPNAIGIFRELKKMGPKLMAVRIDSGDLEYLSKKAREAFDEKGLHEVKIFASSDLDEWIIEHLKNSGAPIDAWGVGTSLVTGGSESSLTGVYKIAAIKKSFRFDPVIKISNDSEKMSNPGIKNIMRFYTGNNEMTADLIFLEEEKEELLAKIGKKEPVHFHHPFADFAEFTLKEYGRGKILLNEVMSGGKITRAMPPLDEIREFRNSEITSLDHTYRRLLNPHRYKVSLSGSLKRIKTELIGNIQGKFNF